MTTQEAYEKIRSWFSQPGIKLAREGGTCYYRLELEDGTICKCAIGALISDDKYKPSMEHKPYNAFIGDIPELEGIDDQFLGDARYAHDYKATDATDYVRILDVIAHDYPTQIHAAV